MPPRFERKSGQIRRGLCQEVWNHRGKVNHYTCRLLGLNYEDFTYHRLSPPDIPRTYLVFPLHAKSRHPFTILLKFQDLKITLVDAPHPPHVKYITIGPIVSSRELPDLLLARRYVLVKDTFTYIRVADRRARHFLFGAVNSYNRTSGNTGLRRVSRLDQIKACASNKERTSYINF